MARCRTATSFRSAALSSRPKFVEKLVKVDDFDVDLTSSEHLAFFRYDDRPGVVGILGHILGEHGINIAGMQVARDTRGGHALVALTVDSALPVAVLEAIINEIGAEYGPRGRPRRSLICADRARSRQHQLARVVVLMAFGDGPDPSLSGIVHVREVEPDESSTDGVLPGVGPVRITDDRHRVAKRGALVRRERLDGQPMAIFGQDTKWIWLDGDERPTAFRSAGYLGMGRPTGWCDVDRSVDGERATTPLTRPVRRGSTTMLSRAAWTVETSAAIA